MKRRRVATSLAAVTAVGGLAFGGVACGDDSDERVTPAPTQETPTEEPPKEPTAPEPRTPQPNVPEEQTEPPPERADLKVFRFDDRSTAGFTDIWVVWTITNSSRVKSDYSWDWEVINAQGVRVANSSEYETDVLPGQTAKGEDFTTLDTLQGMKLNVTSFDRTESSPY